MQNIDSLCRVNPFLASVPVSHPLKTPETLWFSGVFRGYEIGAFSQERVKSHNIYNSDILLKPVNQKMKGKTLYFTWHRSFNSFETLMSASNDFAIPIGVRRSICLHRL